MRTTVLLLAATVIAGCGAAPVSAPPPSSPHTTTTAVTPTVHPVTADELGASWHPGCPVGPDELRRVDVDFLGMDGRTHRGELVVHRDVVAEVREVFAELYRLRFPIEKMRTPEHYPGAEDELSMRDNNTSAFSCRGIPGSGNWSLHAYGRAVDINPLVNPAVHAGEWIEPATAGKYLDRARTDPGMLHDGDPVVRLFTGRGWTWGGHWRNPKDYQHFELPAQR